MNGYGVILCLQATNAFKPSWEYGGPARNSYEISKKLTEMKHEVTVYTTDGFQYRLNVKKNKPISVDGIRTYHFGNLSMYLMKKMNLPIPYYLLIVVNREIKDFDVIHIHEYRTVLAITTSYYAKKYGIPYVLQARGSLLPIFEKKRLKKIFDIFFGYEILRSASKVIALTKTEVEQYKKMGVNEDKIEIAPNGIDLSQYDNLPGKGEFRKKHGIKNDEKIILYLGRIHKSKGIDLLIGAFADLTKKLHDVNTHNCWTGWWILINMKGQIEDLRVGNRILFTGPLYERDKLEAYVDADIFVNPRADEIFGIVFLEACACKIPVICSTGCGIASVIDGGTGLAVPYDKDKLREAIFNILNNKKLRRRFGEEGRRLVKEYFSWDKIVKRIEKTYRDITN